MFDTESSVSVLVICVHLGGVSDDFLTLPLFSNS